LAAIQSSATHLVTGDLRHFGRYYGGEVQGALIVAPADYLASREEDDAPK
jgi:hypothetical protein